MKNISLVRLFSFQFVLHFRFYFLFFIVFPISLRDFGCMFFSPSSYSLLFACELYMHHIAITNVLKAWTNLIHADKNRVRVILKQFILLSFCILSCLCHIRTGMLINFEILSNSVHRLSYQINIKRPRLLCSCVQKVYMVCVCV